jgi:hypothetical protein
MEEMSRHGSGKSGVIGSEFSLTRVSHHTALLLRID